MSIEVRAPRGLSERGRGAIASLFRAHLQRGWHPGAALAVYRDGELVVDMLAGDAGEARPLRRDDRLLLFSSMKPVIAVCIHILRERGVIALEDRIARYWPEFAQGGKSSATVRHALTHQAGCPQLPSEFDLNRVDDWAYAVSETASVPAAWVPGTDTGYHTLTFGWILGELVRRVDGRMPREFMRDEIFEPLGIADEISLGLPEDQLECRVPVHAMSERTRHDAVGRERATSKVARAYNSTVVARAQIPAANGYGTARALARFYDGLLGSVEGRGPRLLRPDTVIEAASAHVDVQRDRSQDVPKRYGLGFYLSGLRGDPFDYHDGAGVFGHSGQQSSVGYADPRLGIAVAYVTNGLHEPEVVYRRAAEMAAAVRAACL
jgi:CubicO group peptidase (beta-lactamase class C family)